jgi:hypothetical protein
MASSERTKTVGSVVDLIKAIQRLPPVKDGFYTFRGERDFNWATAPGILRKDRGGLLANERHIVRELLSVHPQEFASDSTMFDRLVRMQHYNLPTRLMDVTANPHVALYFASDLPDNVDGKVSYIRIPDRRRKYFDSDTVSCVANLANLAPEEKSQILRNIRNSYDVDVEEDTFHDLLAVDRLYQFIKAEKPYFRKGMSEMS